MRDEKKRRLVLWLLVGALLAASALWLLRPQASGPRLVATVTVGDREVRRVELATAGDQEFSILDETGLPVTFQVKDHAIRFLSSDCPDKVCVNTGFLKNDLEVACCLPNQTTLFISQENS